jgi:ribosomal protein S4E
VLTGERKNKRYKIGIREHLNLFKNMSKKLVDGARCKVIGGTHKGKYGKVTDINTSKTGHVTITVVPSNGVRFKTLAKNVEIL